VDEATRSGEDSISEANCCVVLFFAVFDSGAGGRHQVSYW
jgi:hypothetical protein